MSDKCPVCGKGYVVRIRDRHGGVDILTHVYDGYDVHVSHVDSKMYYLHESD